MTSLCITPDLIDLNVDLTSAMVICPEEVVNFVFVLIGKNEYAEQEDQNREQR